MQGQVHQIVSIVTNHRPMGGHHDDIKTVDLLEFKGLGIGGSGHARQFFVQAKIILKGRRRQRLTFILNR